MKWKHNHALRLGIPRSASKYLLFIVYIPEKVLRETDSLELRYVGGIRIPVPGRTEKYGYKTPLYKSQPVSLHQLKGFFAKSRLTPQTRCVLIPLLHTKVQSQSELETRSISRHLLVECPSLD
jgi:hypothetical protein